MTETATKGRGMLYFSVSYYEEMEYQPTTPEAWRKTLLLPENYIVESVVCNQERGLFELMVVSDALPEGDNVKHVEVNPSYIQHFDREAGSSTVTLNHIRISQWDGERWNEIAEKQPQV